MFCYFACVCMYIAINRRPLELRDMLLINLCVIGAFHNIVIAK